jgi:hypothetical protein
LIKLIPGLDPAELEQNTAKRLRLHLDKALKDDGEAFDAMAEGIRSLRAEGVLAQDIAESLLFDVMDTTSSDGYVVEPVRVPVLPPAVVQVDGAIVEPVRALVLPAPVVQVDFTSNGSNGSVGVRTRTPPLQYKRPVNQPNSRPHGKNRKGHSVFLPDLGEPLVIHLSDSESEVSPVKIAQPRVKPPSDKV